ncbi:MAG: SUMF1/EgtB/PvdO family nonheme iron enzyme [Anaerolineae bacterium]
MTLPPIRIDLVEIPAGRFSMGSSLNDHVANQNEMPQRDEYLDTFYISRYPVTNREYKLFVDDTGHRKPSHWLNQGKLVLQENHPVVCVSFEDAKDYCNWVSAQENQLFRLPTEKEWEKAARGNKDSRQYPWGDKWKTYRCNTKESGHSATTPVTEYEKHQENIYGVIDFIGNVWEWTDSWYQLYKNSQHKSKHYGETHRVIRGGSYHNEHQNGRISARGRYLPEITRPYVGFRLASDALGRNLAHSNSLELETITQDLDSYFGNEKHQAVDPAKLQQALIKHFNLPELKQLILNLGLPYDDDFTNKRTEMARELVGYCQRHGLISKLIEQADKARPTLNVDWWQTSEN